VTNVVSLGRRVRIGATSIVLFVLFIGFLLGILVLNNWSTKLLFGFILVIALLAIPVTWVLGKIFRNSHQSNVFPSYIKIAFLLILLLTTIVTFPFYYLAIKSASDPLVLPQAILSNGDKTVVFQGMVHVGSEGFYKSVIYDLEEALDEGYKLYYEGIMPSTDEANKWFSDTIVGGGDLSSHYRELAEVCGVKFQLDYFQLMVHDMQQHPDQHATVDVNTADLKNEYERLLKTDSAFAQAVTSADIKKQSDQKTSDIYADKILAYVKNANDGQKTIIGVICRGVFSIALKPSAKEHTDPLDPVLLSFRNQHLVNQILSENNKKIYITYGAGHLPGVITLLQTADPAWEVKSLKWLRGMAAPEHLEGQL
jgi:hypothetical protein